MKPVRPFPGVFEVILLLALIATILMFGAILCSAEEAVCRNGQCTPKRSSANSAFVFLSHTDHEGPGYFSGVLIDTPHENDLILTCAHALKHAGNTMAIFADGQRIWANIIAKDHYMDLALLQVRKSNRQKFSISINRPARGEIVAGFGFGGAQNYRESQGPVIQYQWLSKPETQDTPPDCFEFQAAVRTGDSGGPVLNRKGQIVGVIFGGGKEDTNAIDCVRINQFLKTALLDKRVQGTSDPQSPPVYERKKSANLGATNSNAIERLPLVTVDSESINELERKNKKPKPSTKDLAPRSGRGLLGILDGVDWYSLAAFGGKVAAGSAGVGLTGGAGWAAWVALQAATKLYRRRKARKGSLAVQAAEPFSPIARDDTEAKQLLQLSQLEGRNPVHDAIVGRFTFDTIDLCLANGPDGPEADALRKLRVEIESRFNKTVPLAVLKEEEEK